MADLDPEVIAAMAENLQRLRMDAEALESTLGGTFDAAAKDFDRMTARAESRWKKLSDSMVAGMGKVGTRLKNLAGPGGQSGFGKPSGPDAVTRIAAHTTGVVQGFQRHLASIGIAGLPFGGLLGLMMFGKWKEAEYTARGNKIAQQFEGLGDIGNNVAGRLGSNVRRLSLQLGRDIAGELESLASGLSEFGVTAEQAFGKTSRAAFKTDGATRTLGETLFVLDQGFEGGGAAFKTAGQLIIDTNMSLRDSVTLTKNIGLAAGAVGMKFSMFSAVVTQATSALRMQGVEAESIADTIATVSRQYQKMGMQSGRAAAMAASGIQGAADALANMDIGMKAILGERMTGGRVTGLAAGTQFERGTLGAGEQFGASIAELIEITKENTNDEASQYYMLKQFLGGNAQAADALMRLQEAGGKDQGAIKKLAEQQSGRLKGMLDKEAQKANVFERHMNVIRDAIGQLGAGLMKIMLAGFGQLSLIYQIIRGYITGEKVDWEAVSDASMGLERATKEAWGKIQGAAGTIGKELGGSARDLGLVVPGVLSTGHAENVAPELRGRNTFRHDTRGIMDRLIREELLPERSRNKLYSAVKGVSGRLAAQDVTAPSAHETAVERYLQSDEAAALVQGGQKMKVTISFHAKPGMSPERP